MFSQRAVVALLAVAFNAVSARAQNPAPADSLRDDLPRVFLDCQANGCDNDFLRTELTWLNFVRDRTLATVHVLATSQATGSGGTELTVAFIGLGVLSGKADTIVAVSQQSDTFDERRQLLRRVISQGMLRFVANTDLASRLSVAYRAPAAGAASATRGARDKWNLWVFRVGGGSFFNGEESYKYYNINGSVEARRTTAENKIFINFRGNKNQDRYTIPGDPEQNIPDEVLVTKRRSYNAEALWVKSINQHWSAGLQANASSSITSNLDLGTRFGPAIEYDVFPYSESTRRQIIARYSVGVKSLNYDSLTIFDKLKETRPDHRLVVAGEATQPWGGFYGNITASQYLNEPSKYRIDGYAGMNWRIVRGLNIGFDMGYTKLRDQLNLKRGTASQEEVLLRLRQLATGYYYYGSINISYTFGSVFSNVVNPRF
ncbi:MAG TPA: hypothetical protein VFZ73_19845, partial [Gemmatimonadaceae bacterium]